MRRHYWKTGTKSVFACVPSDNFLTKETEESTSDSVISTSVLLYEFWSEQMEEVGGEEIVEQLLLLMLRIGVLDLRVFSFCKRSNILVDFLSFCCNSLVSSLFQAPFYYFYNPWFLLLIDHRVCSPSLTQLDLTVYCWKLFVPDIYQVLLNLKYPFFSSIWIKFRALWICFWSRNTFLKV